MSIWGQLVDLILNSQTNMIRIVWLTITRIKNLTWELKG